MSAGNSLIIAMNNDSALPTIDRHEVFEPSVAVLMSKDALELLEILDIRILHIKQGK